MLLEGNSFYVPAQSLSFLNVAYNFTDSGGKTPYSRVLHCEGENNKDGEWKYALISSNGERLSKKNSLSADILPISKDSINESLGEILAFPRNAAHNFQKQPASEKKEARTKRVAKASSKNEDLIITQPKQKDALHSDTTAHEEQTVHFSCAHKKSLECMEIVSRVLDALEQDPVLVHTDSNIREQSFSETLRSEIFNSTNPETGVASKGACKTTVPSTYSLLKRSAEVRMNPSCSAKRAPLAYVQQKFFDKLLKV